MTELNIEDRALVDLAREGCEPTDSDRRRMRIALAAQLGVGAGLTSATAVGAATASAGGVAGGAASAGAAGAGAIKVLAAVLLGGAVAGGGAFVVREEMRSSRAPAAVQAQVPVTQAVTPGGVDPGKAPETAAAGVGVAMESAPATATAPAPVPAPVTVPAPTPAPATSIASATAPRSAPPTATPVEVLTAAPSTTLDAETQLIRAGVGALHAGDAAGALAAFEQHARLYPDGFLAEERSGERVFALCDLGRKADASDAARAFLAAYPRSPLAARVRASCATPSNP